MKSFLTWIRIKTLRLKEGAHIAAILLIWSIPAIAFVYGISFEGDSFGVRILPSIPLLGGVFAVTGFLNAIHYICCQVIDHWHETVQS